MKCSKIVVLAVILASVTADEITQKSRRRYRPYRTVLRTSDIERDGWQMVFRGTSGNGHSVYDAWVKGIHATSVKPTSMERSNGQHYRDNKIVHEWRSLGIKHVKFAYYTEDKEVAYVIFDGKFTDLVSWFDHKRVQSSSWPRLASQKFNYFSIAGHAEVDRRFFINEFYGGCPNDFGYMVVMNAKSRAPCHWDSQPAYPQFLYSRFTTGDFWDRRMFGIADYMAIFINRKSLS